MCHVCPPLWAFSDLKKNFNVTVRIGPLRLIHIFLLSILSVVPSVWPVFGFIFRTRDLRRNLRIWWRVRTTSDDVTFTLKVPSCQVAILDRQNPIISFRHNSTKKYFFSKVRLVSDSARSDLSKEPIKSDSEDPIYGYLMWWDIWRKYDVIGSHTYTSSYT